MILRHEETVTVDERGLDQRAHRFPKSEGDKLSLHHPQEPQVGMILARKGPRDSRRYIVAPKLDLLPLTRDNHVPSKGTHFRLECSGCPDIPSRFCNLNFAIIPYPRLDKAPLPQTYRRFRQTSQQIF